MLIRIIRVSIIVIIAFFSGAIWGQFLPRTFKDFSAYDFYTNKKFNKYGHHQQDVFRYRRRLDLKSEPFFQIKIPKFAPNGLFHHQFVDVNDDSWPNYCPLKHEMPLRRAE